MAKKQKPTTAPADDGLKNVSDYRFPEARRKNNPPAKIAAEGYVPLIPKAEYLYSPRRPPELRFDPTGRADELPDLLAKATKEKLTEAEACVRQFVRLAGLAPLPDILDESRTGRWIHQSRLRFEDGKMYLLRVVVAEDEQPPVIITAYRTSKIEKYWSAE